MASSLNNLALVAARRRTGSPRPSRYTGGRWKFGEKALGSEHLQVAAGLSNLALLLQATNRPGEAEPLMRRALAIDEKATAPTIPMSPDDLNNLAGLLQATNRLEEAEPLMRRVVQIVEKTLGPDHPHLAIRLNNLAGLLKATNRLAEAEPLYRRALEIDEKSYGPDHPDVAIDLNNLALLLQDTNRLAEAEPMMRRALEIFQNSLGLEHPKAITVRGTWPRCCVRLGKAVARGQWSVNAAHCNAPQSGKPYNCHPERSARVPFPTARSGGGRARSRRICSSLRKH